MPSIDRTLNVVLRRFSPQFASLFLSPRSHPCIQQQAVRHPSVSSMRVHTNSSCWASRTVPLGCGPQPSSHQTRRVLFHRMDIRGRPDSFHCHGRLCSGLASAGLDLSKQRLLNSYTVAGYALLLGFPAIFRDHQHLWHEADAVCQSCFR